VLGDSIYNKTALTFQMISATKCITALACDARCSQPDARHPTVTLNTCCNLRLHSFLAKRAAG
jgi:hypothetical protein